MSGRKTLLVVVGVIFLSGAAVAVPPTAMRLPTDIFVQRLGLLCEHQVVQSFPIAGPAQTTWRICWREVRGVDSVANPNGLVIGPVYFQKAPSAPFIRILWDMRVSDYFVPYHPGSPRYYDLSGFNFVLAPVTSADCPASAGGATLSATVCKEVHDRGLMWKDGSGVRRGEEFVLWGAIDAANYRYIQEYTFRDDGLIGARMGATGQNLPGEELITHVHNAIWRIDVDLDGVTNQTTVIRHAENIADPSGVATDSRTAVTSAQGFEWDARRHDVIEIANLGSKNALGHVITYQLIPQVTGGGLTQHHEAFTQSDFWVTPYTPAQFAAKDLPSYVATRPAVDNRDLVVWYKGSLHHHPRDEDGVYNAQHQWVGTADVMWTGFVLMPHDVLDCSPFFVPCP